MLSDPVSAAPLDDSDSDVGSDTASTQSEDETPRIEQSILNQFYNLGTDTARCVITLFSKDIEYAHVIPLDPTNVRINWLRLRGLLPKRQIQTHLRDYYAENLVPLLDILHNDYKEARWTFFLPLATIHDCIIKEELDIVNRMATMNAGQTDPGRSVSYDDQQFEHSVIYSSACRWQAVGRAEHPPRAFHIGAEWPLFKLLVPPPISIIGNLPRLMQLRFAETRYSPQFFDSLIQASSYLLRLWDWSESPNLSRTLKVLEGLRNYVGVQHQEQLSNFEKAFPKLVELSPWPAVQPPPTGIIRWLKSPRASN